MTDPIKHERMRDIRDDLYKTAWNEVSGDHHSRTIAIVEAFDEGVITSGQAMNKIKQVLDGAQKVFHLRRRAISPTKGPSLN
jgi:hypothetical protein